MNLYHITLRCSRHNWAISPMLVELSAWAPAFLKADQVIADVESRWKSPWKVCGIERTV